MSWTPAQNVIDFTAVIDNLLGYIEANDADALAWANGGEPLEEFAEFYSSITGRIATKFPQLIVLSQAHSVEEGETDNGEVLVVKLPLVFEGAIKGRNAEEACNTAKRYSYALESMLVNIPSLSLTGDADITASLTEYATRYDEPGQLNKSSSWLQVFQTRCEYQFITSVF